jgi:hypothetical protein
MAARETGNSYSSHCMVDRNVNPNSNYRFFEVTQLNQIKLNYFRRQPTLETIWRPAKPEVVIAQVVLPVETLFHMLITGIRGDSNQWKQAQLFPTSTGSRYNMVTDYKPGSTKIWG